MPGGVVTFQAEGARSAKSPMQSEGTAVARGKWWEMGSESDQTPWARLSLGFYSEPPGKPLSGLCRGQN